MRFLGRHWGLILGSTLVLGAMVALVVLDRRHDTLRAGITPRTIGWYLVAVAGFLVALWWNERRTIPTWVLWSVPVVARLLLITTEPTLSDDVYRYLWEGHLLTEGISPYRHPIDAPALDPVAIPIRELANNRGLASPYLPTALALFAAAALVLPSTAVVMQVIMVALDLATGWLVYRLLPRAGIPAGRVLLYLWNPLVMIEIAHGAHLDALMAALTMAALFVGLRPQPDPNTGAVVAGRRGPGSDVTSAVLLALAVLTRPIPVLVTPVLWPRWRWRARAAYVVTGVGAVVPFGLGAAGWGLGETNEGTGLFGSARVYSREFRFNGALNDVLEPGTTTAAVVVGGLMAAVLALVWWRATIAARGPDPVRATRDGLRLAAVPVAAYVVLTPVLHPWYLVILLALVPALTPASGEGPRRWAVVVPCLYLAAAAPFSYLTYLDPDRFAELAWVRRVEWLPTLTLAVGAAPVVAGPAARGRRRRRPADEVSRAGSTSAS